MGLLSNVIKNPIRNPKRGPLWDGPSSNTPNGGSTFSLLSRFLVCRERFRIHAIEGLRPTSYFNHRLEFGNMWHLCEEYDRYDGEMVWEKPLQEYAENLCKKYPFQQEQIDHWYRICKAQFPIYLEYWSKHPDVRKCVVLEQEKVFNTSYKLPSGRIVYLRGKRDRVDLIDNGIWLQENKTKNDIDENLIKRQLTFDLQTMLYMIVLEVSRYDKPLIDEIPKGSRIAGVRYNVIRRHCPIRQHKPSKSKPQGEGRDEFYKRLTNDYFKANPEEWFMRWNVEIRPDDINRFRDTCLDPILENLCWWYEWAVKDPGYLDGSREVTYGIPPCHWVYPFGVYNPIDEQGFSDVDQYIIDGSEIGLERAETLFPELET